MGEIASYLLDRKDLVEKEKLNTQESTESRKEIPSNQEEMKSAQGEGWSDREERTLYLH